MLLRSNKIHLAGIILIIVFSTGCNHKIPKILIIGDSISIGYMPFVKEHFEGEAIISHNPGNAQNTGNGLKKINGWLGDEKWDIIQFNWGLWDLCYRNPDSKVQGNRDKINGKITYSLEEYKSNLNSLVTLLQERTKAKLIFVTTTYIPRNEVGRYTEDAIRYNNAAKEIMEKHDVLINDIYKQSIPIHKKYGMGSDNVHYTDEGYKKLSKPLIDFLEKEMTCARP